MSLDSQLARVSQGTKDTLKAIINKLGGNVGDEMIDQYPDLANALANIGDLSSGAIPSSEKGVASGVATLGEDGKVPSEQLPDMDYANSTHASQHSSGGSDPITPESIGSLPANGTAESAKKLATARTFRTNLASTSTVSFDGSADVTPGVTGTLPAGNGGTGQTTITPAVTTHALRASYAGTSAMTASSTSLTTGKVYLQYE